MTEGER